MLSRRIHSSIGTCNKRYSHIGLVKYFFVITENFPIPSPHKVFTIYKDSSIRNYPLWCKFSGETWQENRGTVATRGRNTGVKGRIRCTGADDNISLRPRSPSSSPPISTWRCHGPFRVPLHVICIETSRRDEKLSAFGQRAIATRRDVERPGEPEETLEGGSGFVLEF